MNTCLENNIETKIYSKFLSNPIQIIDKKILNKVNRLSLLSENLIDKLDIENIMILIIHGHEHNNGDELANALVSLAHFRVRKQLERERW